LNAAAYNDVADRENIDPLTFSSSPKKSRISQLRAEETAGEDTDESESSFETVIRYNSKSEWTQSTPAMATKAGRKSTGKRRSMKSKSSATTHLYPQLSVYPDIHAETPTATTEGFSKIAEGIVQEMNTRIAGTLTKLTCIDKSETSRKTSHKSPCPTNILRHAHPPQRIPLHHKSKTKTKVQ